MRRAKQKMRCRYNLPPLTDTTYKGNRKEGKIMKATGIVRRIDELGRDEFFREADERVL